MKLQVVIPAHNEQENIVRVIDELIDKISKIDLITSYNIVVVDDHSSDSTFSKVKALNQPHVKCIRLSRRSGSHTAIRAGLQQSTGDVTLCISADGQDNCNILGEMILKIKEGSNIVWGLRKKRDEDFRSELFARWFYFVLGLLTKNNKDIDYSRADYYLMDKRVLNSINSCNEKNTSLFGLLIWIGFNQTYVEYDRRERLSGNSKWNFNSRVKLAKDWIFSFSGVPIKLISWLGYLSAGVGIIYSIILFIWALLGKTSPGWAENAITILIVSGIQMLMLGIVADYVLRNLDESRNRPLYFIEKESNE
ncbi:MAG: glycosyltransferase [Bacteroidota bacterium]